MPRSEQQGGGIQVVDPANLPEKPVAPKRLMLTGGRLWLLAWLLGMLLVLIFEVRRLFTIQTIEDAKHYTGLPVLASIPELRTPSEALAIPRRQKSGLGRRFRGRSRRGADAGFCSDPDSRVRKDRAVGTHASRVLKAAAETPAYLDGESHVHRILRTERVAIRADPRSALPVLHPFAHGSDGEPALRHRERPRPHRGDRRSRHRQNDLLRWMMQRLDRTVMVAYIFNPRLSVPEFYQYLATLFNIRIGKTNLIC
jgi:hypothetical protein